MNEQEIRIEVYGPTNPPVLKRSYKAFCNRCGIISSCVNMKRSVVCDSCVPFETQKRCSRIISDICHEYLDKRYKAGNYNHK